MKLRLKINLFSLVIPALMAFIVITTGISVMNRVIIDLNRKLIEKDIENLFGLIDSDHNVLKKAGVDNHPQYVSQAKLDFLKNLSNRDYSTEGELIILDTLSETQVYPTRRSLTSYPDMKREMFVHISGDMTISEGNERFYINYIKIPYWNWILVIIISSKDLFLEIQNYLRLVIPLSIIPVLSGLILTYFFLKKVISRINDSLQCLREVENGNLSVRIKTEPINDEIHEIQLAINRMINSLRSFYLELENRVEQRTEELAESNLRLKEEINSGELARTEISYLNQYLKNIIDSMPSILIGINRDSTINKWNPEASRVSGFSEADVLDRNFLDYFNDNTDLINKLIDHIDSEEPLSDLHMKLKVGGSEEFYGDISYFPLREKRNEMGILQIRDITEKFQLEELIKHSEKMLSVGGLAAGMAHEINNPLAGMMQSAQNIKRRLSTDVPVNRKKADELGITLESIISYSKSRNIPDMIQSILDSGKQAAEIVDNMVSFSQSNTVSNSLHNIDEILKDAFESLKEDKAFISFFERDRLTLTEDYAENLPQVPCDQKKLEQAFFNIMRNAIQVLSNSNIENPSLCLRLYARDDAMMIEIEDNGPGIDESIRKRIFEPFFSTKDVNQGKGLGLSISYYIIRDHHRGNLWLEKTGAGGSLFVISLPLHTIRDKAL